MMNELENIFVDTDIFVYAYDLDETERHPIAKRIVQDCFQGKQKLAVSNQIIAEFARVMLYKTPPRLEKNEVLNIIEEILSNENWIKVNYSAATVFDGVKSMEPNSPFWDAVIAQTMLENGITRIYTEKTNDFSKIKGIKAVNPFRK